MSATPSPAVAALSRAGSVATRTAGSRRFASSVTGAGGAHDAHGCGTDGGCGFAPRAGFGRLRPARKTASRRRVAVTNAVYDSSRSLAVRPVSFSAHASRVKILFLGRCQYLFCSRVKIFWALFTTVSSNLRRPEFVRAHVCAWCEPWIRRARRWRTTGP